MTCFSVYIFELNINFRKCVDLCKFNVSLKKIITISNHNQKLIYKFLRFLVK